MSTLDIITLFAYACALIGALFSKPDAGKVKWLLCAILILLGYIAGEAGP